MTTLLALKLALKATDLDWGVKQARDVSLCLVKTFRGQQLSKAEPPVFIGTKLTHLPQAA